MIGVSGCATLNSRTKASACAHRDLLLEVDGRLVPAPHQVRHDRLGRREVPHEVAVGPPPQHGRGCYTDRPLVRGSGYRRRVAFVDLLAHPDVVEEQVLASPVGFLALHGGLEPGTAEIAREAARRSGASCYAIVQPDDLKHHVPSHENDPAHAPLLAGFLAHVEVVVSVHGYWGHDELHSALLVGGGDRALAADLADAPAGRAARVRRDRRARPHPASAARAQPPQSRESRRAAGCRSSCPTRCGRSAPTAGASAATCTARTPRRWSRRWPTSRPTST